MFADPFSKEEIDLIGKADPAHRPNIRMIPLNCWAGLSLSVTDEFERWLDTEFENPAEEAVRRVVQEARMSPEHWRLLARFAVSLDVRTPVRLREFIRQQNKSLQELMDTTRQRSVQELEDAARRNEPLPRPSEDSDATSIFKISIEPLPDGSGQVKAEAIVGRRLWVWQMRHPLTKTLDRLTS